jgi:hypothetical protein
MLPALDFSSRLTGAERDEVGQFDANCDNEQWA